jgi:hypothetical protein
MRKQTKHNTKQLGKKRVERLRTPRLAANHNESFLRS